ncbi:hypothetical protein [Ectopseudomonas hydrolytica]|uniref:hypothetical protein n=1 Tax=Ectopseudomonas hydrolytica TaxID=2493633 RepID=UPI003C305572
MGFQDREYVRNRGRESRRSSQLNESSPWRREGSGFQLSKLIGFLLTLGAGFILGAIYGDWALSLIHGFA